MANSLTPLSPTFWSKIMGKKVYKMTVYKALASSEEQASLTLGQIVDRPYRSNLVVHNYTKGTAATAQDLTATSDQLTINLLKTILMYIDDVDKIQNKWDAAKAWADEAGKRLAISIDAEFLYRVVDANAAIDDGDLGGVSGNPFTITASNISNVAGKINRKLDANNVNMERTERFWAISPQCYDVLWQYISGKNTLLGDKTSEYGNMGRFGGLELFITNNLAASAVATPTAAPTANDTITIAGTVFTFVDTIGTTAGNVLVNGGTVAQVITRLTALINAPTVTTANGVAFAAGSTDLANVQNMVATDGTTIITVYLKGGSFLTVLSSSGNIVWSKKIQHNLAGHKGAIDVVVQQEPDVQMASTVANGKRGMNVMPLAVFGIKTFNQGKNEIFDVQVNSAGF